MVGFSSGGGGFGGGMGGGSGGFDLDIPGIGDAGGMGMGNFAPPPPPPALPQQPVNQPIGQAAAPVTGQIPGAPGGGAMAPGAQPPPMVPTPVPQMEIPPPTPIQPMPTDVGVQPIDTQANLAQPPEPISKPDNPIGQQYLDSVRSTMNDFMPYRDLLQKAPVDRIRAVMTDRSPFQMNELPALNQRMTEQVMPTLLKSMSYSPFSQDEINSHVDSIFSQILTQDPQRQINALANAPPEIISNLVRTSSRGPQSSSGPSIEDLQTSFDSNQITNIPTPVTNSLNTQPVDTIAEADMDFLQGEQDLTEGSIPGVPEGMAVLQQDQLGRQAGLAQPKAMTQQEMYPLNNPDGPLAYAKDPNFMNADQWNKQINQWISDDQLDSVLSELPSTPEVPNLRPMNPGVVPKDFRSIKEQIAEAQPQMSAKGFNPQDNRSYIDKLIAFANQAFPDNPNMAAIAVTQALHEGGGHSGVPVSSLAKVHNNLFGIKGSGTAGSYNAKTKEFINGKMIDTKDGFSSNKTLLDSFNQYKNLMNKPLYNKVKNAKNPAEAFKALQKAGYATDPQYASKLGKVYNKYVQPKYGKLPIATGLQGQPMTYNKSSYGKSSNSNYAPGYKAGKYTYGGKGTPKGYMNLAKKYLGYGEKTHAKPLAAFFKKVLGKHINPNKVAWCAAFANAVLKSSGLPGTGSLMAKSFLNYGTATTSPVAGDIAVLHFSKDPKSPFGHVGFVHSVSKDGKYVTILGGNQTGGLESNPVGGSVSLKTYPISKVMGFRKVPELKGKK